MCQYQLFVTLRCASVNLYRKIALARRRLTIDVRLEELDLKTARLFVRRFKGSLSTEHPLEGDELRAIRAWLRIRGELKFAHLPHLFVGERGPMTRQAVN